MWGLFSYLREKSSFDGLLTNADTDLKESGQQTGFLLHTIFKLILQEFYRPGSLTVSKC